MKSETLAYDVMNSIMYIYENQKLVCTKIVDSDTFEHVFAHIVLQHQSARFWRTEKNGTITVNIRYKG